MSISTPAAQPASSFLPVDIGLPSFFFSPPGWSTIFQLINYFFFAISLLLSLLHSLSYAAPYLQVKRPIGVTSCAPPNSAFFEIPGACLTVTSIELSTSNRLLQRI